MTEDGRQQAPRQQAPRQEAPRQRPRVAVVTGGSRGVGRGIAIALGAHGYTVYVTGRTRQPGGDSARSGTIHHTATAITKAGGQGVAAHVDHRNDDEVEALFKQVRRDEGRLDLLVNNAALIHDELQSPLPFWEKPLAASVDLLEVGLRSGLVASYYAAPLLVETGPGLVVFTSAPGAVHYQYGAAYGAHKAGMDKFAADMAVDFRPFGVSAVSIWMGVVLTERVQQIIDSGPELAYLADIAETPEFTGHVIAALASDPDLRDVSGRTLIGAEVARQYGITDRDGRRPPSVRELMSVQPATYHGRIHR
jgi:NAD(P)-dependent dehydrogenase (short-subunit alcohol dehydrogenase family)